MALSTRGLMTGICLPITRRLGYSFASNVIAKRSLSMSAPSLMDPIGVQAALAAHRDPNFKPRRTIFDEFSLDKRVAVVTGGKQGLGLEMAMAMAEAGAIVHCLDLPPKPSKEFEITRDYIVKLGGAMHYASADVTNQKEIWTVIEAIATKEGRLDVAIAAAGILHGTDCLNYKDTDFQKVRSSLPQYSGALISNR